MGYSIIAVDFGSRRGLVDPGCYTQVGAVRGMPSRRRASSPGIDQHIHHSGSGFGSGFDPPLAVSGMNWILFRGSCSRPSGRYRLRAASSRFALGSLCPR